MASQVQVIQTQNPFLAAVTKSLGDIGTGIAKGIQASETRTQQAALTNANVMKANLDALAQSWGGLPFNDYTESGRQNLATISTMLDAVERASGRKMTGDERLAYINMYKGAPIPNGKSQDDWNKFNEGIWPSYPTQAAAPATGVAKDVAATTPSSAAREAAQAGVRAAAPAVDPRVANASNFLHGAYSNRILSTPKVGASLGPGMGTISSATSYELAAPIKNVLANYAHIPEVSRLLQVFRRDDLSPIELQQSAARSLDKIFAMDPLIADQVFKATLEDYKAYNNAAVPATSPRDRQDGSMWYAHNQQGVQVGAQANGTRTLAQHERATGDTHYPARVGVNELIVNERAARQPGVAEAIIALNERFPTNVAASRGAYADGTQSVSMGPAPVERYPDEAPTLDEGGDPRYVPTSAGYGAMSATRGALDAAAEETKQIAATPIDKLKAKGVVTPPPPPTPKAEALWDKVREHADEVQAKYQINYANPDPRERAILARELKVEQGLVRAAMGADPGRADWNKTQSKNIADFLRNASDAEIAVTFGDAAAAARDRQKGREIQWVALSLQKEAAAADNTVNQQIASTLALKALEPSVNASTQFINTDKQGNKTFADKEWAKYISALPYIKNTFDVLNLSYGIIGEGATGATGGDLDFWSKVLRTKNPFSPATEFNLQYGGQGAAPGVADLQKRGSDLAASGGW